MSHHPTPPESIGRYRIVRPLGSGAMGDVFLARDPHIDRELAIKTVRVIGGTPEDVHERQQRLLREARAAGKLLHPNVVTLFDADQADGLLYLAFEYVPGTDLARRAASRPPLTLRQVLTILQQVAAALDYAHASGIVHRDIKPSNILITPHGDAKVADFGIAKIEASSTELTRTGSVVGSPQYMSPEQVRGENLDGRSDVFSLGVVLYELLCRSRPFVGETLSTLVFEILAKEPIAVDHVRPGLPPRLYTLVSRMMAKDRNERVASAREAMNELGALLAEMPPPELEAPAARAMAEGPTRRMPASDGMPPSPSSASPHAPTATQHPAARSPAAPPPPPPPMPTEVATRAAAGTVPVDNIPAGSTVPPVPPGPPPVSGASSGGGRPSPLDTGTYSGAGSNRGTFAVVGILLVLAVVAGIWLGRGGLGGGEDASSEGTTESTASQQASSTDAGEAGSVPGAARDSGADAVPSADPSATDTGSSDPSEASGEPAAGASGTTADMGSPVDGSASDGSAATPGVRTGGNAASNDPSASRGSEPAPPPRTDNPVTPPSRTPPRQASPPRQTSPPAEPRTPPSSTPSASSSSTPTPTAAADVAPEPAAEPRQNRHTAAYDAAAAKVVREVDTGLRFRFDVKPGDTVVKIRSRGERSIVQGRVDDFEADEEDARDMELPGDGDYLITLVHPGFGELSVLAHASASRGDRPHVLRLDLARAKQLVEGGPRRIRAGRGLFFAGQPADAEVFVDGQKRGAVSEFSGARRGLKREFLQLGRGRHTVRLVAPGYEPLEIEVEISPGAEQRVRKVPYRLKKSSGGSR